MGVHLRGALARTFALVVRAGLASAAPACALGAGAAAPPIAEVDLGAASAPEDPGPAAAVELGTRAVAADSMPVGSPWFALDEDDPEAWLDGALPKDLASAFSQPDRGEASRRKVLGRFEGALSRGATAPVLVAAGILWLREGGTSGGDAERRTARATDAFERAVEASVPGTPARAYARGLLALTREQRGDAQGAWRDARALLENAGPDTPGWAFFEVARLFQRQDDAESAALAYAKAATSARDGRARREARARWLALAYNAGDWRDCIDAATARVVRAADEDERASGARAAARCLGRSGGWERTPIGAAPTAAWASIIAACALEASELRRDERAATRAWSAVLERAPSSVEAPLAVAWLASIARAYGDPRGAAALLRQARVRYALGTAWASALRGDRGDDGFPSAETIMRSARAVEMEPAPPPRGDDEAARVDALAKHCLGHPAVRGPVAGAARVHLAVGLRAGQDAEVSVDHAALAGARCLVTEGPAFFRGAARGARVTLEIAP